MTEWSREGKESEPEISVAVRWTRRQMVRVRGDGLQKSRMELKGTVPVQMSNSTVSGSGIGGLGLVSVLVYDYVSALER